MMLQIMDPPGRLEPFVRLMAEPSKGMDWERLDMLLQARAKLHADTEPGNMTWTFRSDGMIYDHHALHRYSFPRAARLAPAATLLAHRG